MHKDILNSSHKQNSHLSYRENWKESYNKDNILSANQSHLSISCREIPQKNISLLPANLLIDSHQNTEYRHNDQTYFNLANITSTNFDLSALCHTASSYIYVIGGCAENSQLAVERLDLQKGSWELAGALLGNRSKFASIVLPDTGNILIMGGKEDDVKTANCEEYVIDEHTFKPSDIKLTCPKSGFGALFLKGKQNLSFVFLLK